MGHQTLKNGDLKQGSINESLRYVCYGMTMKNVKQNLSKNNELRRISSGLCKFSVLSHVKKTQLTVFN
jgi:hypothetical protein